ncbi:glutamine--fructose-6-phosphate transaminase (isomerizing) [Streptomyces canus]|uniref:glutamine--fructose-6-phosphate transaminase (isomerizing) n=1 Tax=Streptomyces canus TaxID=58343 RepID=UPI0030DFB97D
MCGIVGYVGRASAASVIISGLKRLEYRGYDSSGLAVLTDGGLATAKSAGKLANLEDLLRQRPLPGGSTAIGHTRWATHGGPTSANAHPHLDNAKRVAVVHNGIIENFAALRAELAERGHEMASETDTEVVAHLLAEHFAATGDLAEAMRGVCRRLDGAFTLVAVHADVPDTVVGARRDSPLVVGVGEGEYFLASDVAAFIAHTREAIELGQDQVVELRPGSVTVTDVHGEPAEVRPYTVDWDVSAAEKGGYDQFMLKEIAEQPKAVADTLRGRIDAEGNLTLDEIGLAAHVLREVDKIIVVACGTAFHAGLIARYAIERWTRVPCEVELASEFRYRHPIVDSRSLVVAISQSGETMDTLMALRHAREAGAKVLAICNTNGSTIPRESDAVLYTHAGPEVAVASTKAFLTQVVACYLVALHMGQARGTADTAWSGDVATVKRELLGMDKLLSQVVEAMEPVRELARSLRDKNTVLFLGRHLGYPVALEGALKLKELAYMHAEGFAAGELKHGPIALIEQDLPVVVIVPREDSPLHDKIVSNIQEIRARGARTIVVAEDGDKAVVPYADHLIRTPRTHSMLQPLIATVPLQVFACELATARGNEVDQPRNLAKSVTVE